MKYCLFLKGEFSQWYPSKFVIDGITYNNAEQYMMYQKALLFNDDEIADFILHATSSKMCKSLGRKDHNFDEAIWRQHRYKIVYDGNLAKFSQNENLKKRLCETTGILAEANPLDNIWGIGLAIDDVRASNMNTWQGLNLLGFCLTEIREVLKNN